MDGIARIPSRGRLAVAALALAALAALAVVLLTAGASRAHAAAGRVAAAKAPIVIGDTCDCSGVQAASEGGWAPALEVWKDWINSKGGILGHKVQVIEMDNKTNPTAALTNTKSLLGNKKVIAIIPGSGQGVVVSGAITAAKKPAIGGLNDDITWGTNKYVFPIGTTSADFAKVLAAVGAKHAKNKNAADLYCAEVASCKQSEPLFAAGVKQQGGKIVYQAAISSAAADYTAPCLAAKGTNPGYVWVAEGPPQIESVATSCAKNGFKPVWVIPNFDVSMLKTPALNGAQYSFSDALFNSPAASQFQAAVSKFNPGLRSKAGYGEFSYQAWLSGQALAQAITLAKPKGNAVTSADVFRGLYMFKNQTLGGGAPNLTYTKGKVPTVPCGVAATQTNGKLVPEKGSICAH